jgi:hypothetical protein
VAVPQVRGLGEPFRSSLMILLVYGPNPEGGVRSVDRYLRGGPSP